MRRIPENRSLNRLIHKTPQNCSLPTPPNPASRTWLRDFKRASCATCTCPAKSVASSVLCGSSPGIVSTVNKAGKLREPFGEIPYLTSPMGCSRMGGWASCTEAYMWDVAEFFSFVVWLHICFGKGSEDIRVGGLRTYAVASLVSLSLSLSLYRARRRERLSLSLSPSLSRQTVEAQIPMPRRHNHERRIDLRGLRVQESKPSSHPKTAFDGEGTKPQTPTVES